MEEILTGTVDLGDDFHVGQLGDHTEASLVKPDLVERVSGTTIQYTITTCFVSGMNTSELTLSLCVCVCALSFVVPFG